MQNIGSILVLIETKYKKNNLKALYKITKNKMQINSQIFASGNWAKSSSKKEYQNGHRLENSNQHCGGKWSKREAKAEEEREEEAG